MDANRSVRFQCGWSLKSYRKIPKISPGAYIFQRPFEGLIFGGVIFGGAYRLGRKFTVFALLYFVLEGNFQVQAPGGAYIWRGNLTEVFLRYEFGGLIFGGAYTWRGLFSEFYGMSFLDGNAKENSGSCCYNYFFPSFFFLT